jgi:hypothetical protein
MHRMEIKWNIAHMPLASALPRNGSPVIGVDAAIAFFIPAFSCCTLRAAVVYCCGYSPSHTPSLISPLALPLVSFFAILDVRRLPLCIIPFIAFCALGDSEEGDASTTTTWNGGEWHAWSTLTRNQMRGKKSTSEICWIRLCAYAKAVIPMCPQGPLWAGWVQKCRQFIGPR